MGYYTDEHFERMKTDPLLVRQFFWSCLMRWKANGESDVDIILEALNRQTDERLLKMASR